MAKMLRVLPLRSRTADPPFSFGAETKAYVAGPVRASAGQILKLEMLRNRDPLALLRKHSFCGSLEVVGRKSLKAAPRDRGSAGPTRMLFENFKDEGLKVISLAQEEARRVGRCMGTGQLLLGLLRENNGVAGVVMRNFSVPFDNARVEVDKAVSEGTSPYTGQGEAPFTYAARKIIEESDKIMQKMRTSGAWVC
jgi:hypothetical protein